jgi:hypothetical protein
LKKQETERAVLATAGVPADRVLQVLGSMEDDTTAPKIVAATLEKFGRIDVLVSSLFVSSYLFFNNKNKRSTTPAPGRSRTVGTPPRWSSSTSSTPSTIAGWKC